MRAHHALCLQHFIGMGYDPAFVENMKRIEGELLEAPDTPVLLVVAADDICAACIYNDNGVCRTASKVRRFDRHTLRFIGAEAGDVLPYSAIRDRIRSNIIDRGITPELCTDCEWLGICLSEEARYRNSRAKEEQGALQSPAAATDSLITEGTV